MALGTEVNWCLKAGIKRSASTLLSVVDGSRKDEASA